MYDFDHDRILAAAKAAMARAPLTLTNHPARLSEGGPNDFYSNGDYWWPDPARPDGLPYIRRDGASNPDNFWAHRLAMQAMRDSVAALGAAYQLSGDDRYVAKAVEMLTVFFLHPGTRMSPAFQFAQAIPGVVAGRGIGIIDGLHLIEVPRAIEAMKSSKEFPTEALAGLKGWFRDLIAWMTGSQYGRDEAATRNNHTVAYHLQLAVYASLVGEEHWIAECRRRYREDFLPNQMALDGSFPRELARTKPYAYSIFQLENMVTLCQVLSGRAEDMWSFTLPDGRSIRKGLEYLHPYLAEKGKWPYPPDIESWESQPIRQSCLLFAGIALCEPRYLDLWCRLPVESMDREVRRNIAVTQPSLWLD